MSATEVMPCFLDCEASGLGVDSYPIEIAWSYPDGSIESHLLNPALIPEWTYWDHGAERVHGLTREYLETHGEDPREVALRMNTCLEGQTLYSDSKAFDGFWLQGLYEAVGMEMTFSVGCLYKELLAKVLPKYVLQDPVELNQLMDKAKKEIRGREHRAAWDVEYLKSLYSLVIREY